MKDLKGKVAMITGVAAKRSMGHAVAVQLAEDGADLAIVDKFAVPKSIWPGDEAWRGLEEIVEEIKAKGQEALAIVADTSVSSEVDRVVAETLKKYGKIDILVHCVGVRGPIPVPVVDLDESTWRMLLDVNLTGAFLISKAVAKTMIPNGAGRKIVHVSSVAGRQAFPGGAGYSASKHGLLGLVKTLAVELAPYRINVNAIIPGAFDTNFRDESLIKQAKDLGATVEESLKIPPAGPTGSSGPPPIPLGRLGTPQDVANLISFLVSDRSSYITGETINITGGVQ